MRKPVKHLIWGDINLDYDDWKDDIESEYPGISEQDGYAKMYQWNADYLDDERYNLDICVGTPIICIASLGFWHGRKNGYKIIASGNIKECLYSICDFNEWYVDELGDLQHTGIHHDGTNRMMYRALRPGLTERQLERFTDLILDSKFTRKDITRYTVSLGPAIKKAYGWA